MPFAAYDLGQAVGMLLVEATARGLPSIRRQATTDAARSAFGAALRAGLKDAGGVPGYGNDTRDWDLSRSESSNPEYRA